MTLGGEYGRSLKQRGLGSRAGLAGIWLSNVGMDDFRERIVSLREAKMC